MRHPSLASPACLQIRQALELRLGCPLQQYRDFIDNQMLLIMAQQDRASRIFPHLYLVSCRLGVGGGDGQSRQRLNDRLSLFPGLRVERSEPGGAAEKQVGFPALSGLPTLRLPQGETWPETPRTLSQLLTLLSALPQGCSPPVGSGPDRLVCWQLPGPSSPLPSSKAEKPLSA